MNQTRLAVAALLVFLMAAGWITVAGGKAGETAQLAKTLEKAQVEEERGLYAKSIASYEEVLAQKKKKALYEDLARVYALYYEKNPTSIVRRDYDDMLSRANKDYPKEVSFWETRVQLYMDRVDYVKAVKVLRQAKEKGVSSDFLEQQYQNAYYMFKDGYHTYSEILPGCWKDNYVIQTGDGTWGMVTSGGDTVLSEVYTVMGPVGTRGQVVITDVDGESWLVDSKGMLQAHYDRTVTDAGCWNEGMVPARLAGENTWSYLTDDGAAVLSGYLAAGSFYGDRAAVQTAAGWRIIDTEGQPVSEESWEDIRLDANGAFEHEKCILAKSGGKWRIYSSSWKVQGEFACDDIDICADGPIAFCRDGLWGFVSAKGEELIPPTYEQARSFSGGVAAVCRNGLWGFIDQAGREVVSVQFADVGYFDPKEGSCPVRFAEGDGWVFLHWVVNR